MRILMSVAVAAVVMSISTTASALVAYTGINTSAQDSADIFRVVVAKDDGSGAQKLAKGAAASASPDGTKIAYIKDYGQLEGTESKMPAAEPDIYVYDVVTRTTKLLIRNIDDSGEGLGFSWSPSSAAIATVKANKSGFDSIVLADVVSGSATVLKVEKSLRGITNLSFSPDGSELAFDWKSAGMGDSGPSCGGSDVWKVNVATRALTRLTSGGRGSLPVWGPSKIAYTHTKGDRCFFTGTGQIWTMNSDGTVQRSLTRYKVKDGYELEPVAWSSAGNRLVANYVNTEDSDKSAFAIDPVTGSSVELLPELRGHSYATAISRDGERVLVGYEVQTERAKKARKEIEECFALEEKTDDSSFRKKCNKILSTMVSDFLASYGVGVVPYSQPGQLTVFSPHAYFATWNL